MSTQEECQELLMQDIIRIDFMPATALKIGIPFRVPNITSAVVAMSDDSELTDLGLYADSLLSLNMSGDGLADAVLDEGVTYPVTEKDEVAGTVRTHTLQIPIELGSQTIREKEPTLKAADFHIVLTTYGGDRYLAYALPGSCSFSVEEQKGRTTQMSVKASVQSMSSFIKILDPE